MKAWISKYALSDGIFSKDGESTSDEHEAEYFICDGHFLRFGRHAHKTKAEAIAKAEEMRLKRIASLKKQIEKLESMKFD